MICRDDKKEEKILKTKITTNTNEYDLDINAPSDIIKSKSLWQIILDKVIHIKIK